MLADDIIFKLEQVKNMKNAHFFKIKKENLKMDNGIMGAFEPYISEQLGEIYNRNYDYKEAIISEYEIFERLQKDLTEEQKQTLEEYQEATSHTCGICEKLAYRQGMRDMVFLLTDKE